MPNRDRIPKAKAMSVAIGIPQPRLPSPPTLNTAYMIAGTTIPPKAALTGRIDFSSEESCPTTISRLISSPTTKKKTAISKSLIQCCSESSKLESPHEIPMYL